MFDVGFAELFLLSLIGLLVLGPERLPAVARTIGGFVRKARISYHNLKRTVEAELQAAEAANPIKEAQKELESVQQEVKALGDKLSEDQTAALIPTAADPVATATPTDSQAGATAADTGQAEPSPAPKIDAAGTELADATETGRTTAEGLKTENLSATVTEAETLPDEKASTTPEAVEAISSKDGKAS